LVTILAVVVGILFAAGLYLMLRRSIVKLIIGLVLIGHAANLLIFTMSRLVHNEPVIILTHERQLPGHFADPIVQAIILTAIVIGLGVQAFAIVLIKRAYQTVGTDDIDHMRATDLEMD
jgi:multicomponent Na+:H+ antiporter subunit C